MVQYTGGSSPPAAQNKPGRRATNQTAMNKSKSSAKAVKVRRKLYPNCFALAETVSMLTALWYVVKVV